MNCVKKAKIGQNGPKFRVLHAKKYTGPEKSTPLPFVAVVTHMSYESTNGFFRFAEFYANPKNSAALVLTGSGWFGLVQTGSGKLFFRPNTDTNSPALRPA